MAAIRSPRRARILRLAAPLALSLALIALAGCGKKSGDTSTLTPGGTSTQGGTAGTRSDAERLGSAGTATMTALTEPMDPVHYSYKGEVNVNNEFPREPKSEPKLGPVTLEADVDSNDIVISGVRGDKKIDSSAKKTREGDWAMIKMAFLGAPTDVAFTLAFASPCAVPAGTENVAGVDGDKFTFDTRTATAEQKVGMEAAAKFLSAQVHHDAIYGWGVVDRVKGRLIRFNFDAELSDKNGHKWKEHHEGELTPKKAGGGAAKG
ncbi:MAG: hypothetical protein HZB25_03730 [Candidatus Eisenbacteria bacterium]|nr:hypothetical protein [Candidatus Eisenbacteria bacterium]